MLDKLPSPKTTKKQPRVGRGYGRRGGHTVGRGMKGQKSRSGYKAPRKGFEGGQMPLSRRLPTLRGQSKKSRGRGFATANLDHYVLQLSEVADAVKDGKVNNQTLFEAGFITTKSQKISIKILFDQDIDKKLQVEGVPMSENAKKAVEKAGGSVA